MGRNCENTSHPLQIAIDGPVAAGKGDIAARLAEKLQLVYINTGAMYRMVGLLCLQRSIDRKDEFAVRTLLNQSSIDLQLSDGKSENAYKAIVDGEDVTEKLLDPDVSQASSDVATLSSVRKRLVELQKNMAVGKRVVMEGRDIGLRVLPDAQLKIFLTAALEERAKRRWEQWKEKGIYKQYEEVVQETKQRDLQDMTRSKDPLKKLPDAWELDTTDLSQEEVVQRIVEKLKQRKLI